MRLLIVSLALTLLLFVSPAVPAQPPLVDGDCSEYTRLKARRYSVSTDVVLYFYQDKHFVWFCYSYPEGSFATADLKLVTAVFTSGINLHVSAQLGEWPADKPDKAPKNAESDLWWNHKGWTANTVWINGMDRSGPTPRYRFKNAKAREMQLGKERFGRGRWKFSLDIRSIRGADGKTYDVTFPATGQQEVKIS